LFNVFRNILNKNTKMFYTFFIYYSFWENINTASHDQRLGLRFQLSKREEIYDFGDVQHDRIFDRQMQSGKHP